MGTSAQSVHGDGLQVRLNTGSQNRALIRHLGSFSKTTVAMTYFCQIVMCDSTFIGRLINHSFIKSTKIKRILIHLKDILIEFLYHRVS